MVSISVISHLGWGSLWYEMEMLVRMYLSLIHCGVYEKREIKSTTRHGPT